MNSRTLKNFAIFLNQISPLRILRTFKLFLQVKLHRGKLFLEDAVAVNHPIIFQGKGSLIIGRNVTLGYRSGGSNNLSILLQPRESQSEIIIGKGSIINNGTEIISTHKIKIGENCLIGSRTLIYDCDFHGIPPDQRSSPGNSAAIEIKNNVWLGSGVIVLKGVIIEEDSVVGAGSVVRTNIPRGSIVTGNPATIIGSVYS